jgi:hypothetical protein
MRNKSYKGSYLNEYKQKIIYVYTPSSAQFNQNSSGKKNSFTKSNTGSSMSRDRNSSFCKFFFLLLKHNQRIIKLVSEGETEKENEM